MTPSSATGQDFVVYTPSSFSPSPFPTKLYKTLMPSRPYESNTSLFSTPISANGRREVDYNRTIARPATPPATTGTTPDPSRAPAFVVTTLGDPVAADWDPVAADRDPEAEPKKEAREPTPDVAAAAPETTAPEMAAEAELRGCSDRKPPVSAGALDPAALCVKGDRLERAAVSAAPGAEEAAAGLAEAVAPGMGTICAPAPPVAWPATVAAAADDPPKTAEAEAVAARLDIWEKPMTERVDSGASGRRDPETAAGVASPLKALSGCSCRRDVAAVEPRL